MTRPDERRFVLFPRGFVRDQIILAHLRNSMRVLINPDTLVLFTEDEISRFTQSGSKYYIQADAIDLYGQAIQSRDAYYTDQIVPTRSASPFLLNVHGPLWIPDGLLTATGASGNVAGKASAGVIWPGSSTIGDPAATVGTDPNGLSYQVLINAVTDGTGTAALVLKGIDGGDASNIGVGTIIKWRNPPVGAQSEGAVTVAFSGGVDDENEADFAKRIEDRIRHRPASGNQAHFRAWAQQSTNAVENAYVYACALNAGSVVVCVTQKRASVVGPTARIPSFGTLATVTGYLVPPNSPVVPGNVFVLVVPPNPVQTSLGLRVALRRGTPGGWNDLAPWPKASTAFPRAAITGFASQTSFVITTDVAPTFTLPATGVTAPQMMVWRPLLSKFERLNVLSVAVAGANQYTVTLSSAISTNDIALGDVLSPYTDRLDVIAGAAQTYFDGIGPGELVSLDPSVPDLRAHRAYRYPRPSEGFPSKVGQGIVTTFLDILGGAAGDAELVQSTVTTPSLPIAISSGPNMLVLNQLGVYDPDN